MTIAMKRPDRSVPRRNLRNGNGERDGRGRHLRTIPVLQYGFRPFFLLAALHAAIALPVWTWMLGSGFEMDGPFPGLQWHAHEMLFGYVGAVIGGFILTAIPNWTGRLPLSGPPLAILVTLWLAGRAACAAVPEPAVAALLDLAFPSALVLAILREVVAGRNWRNGPVVLVLALFGGANLLHHLEAGGYVGGEHALRLGLAAVTLLMALIGGRVTPSFTRNWLAKRGSAALPAGFGSLDRAAMALTALAAFLWVLWPDKDVTGLLLSISGLLLACRLLRWRGHATISEPILFILHVGYAWLAAALVLIGMAVLAPSVFHPSSALHALTAGAIATMTLAVMTRASLGHTGHAIRADAWTLASYVAVTTGAVLRVLSPYVLQFYPEMLAAAGAFWSLAFALFVIRYGPILASRRK